MKEKIKTMLKNQKVVIAIWVFALTLVTIGFSYSAFFTVKTNKNNQTVTTGNLSVGYGGSSSSVTKTNMLPLSDFEGLSQSETSVIYIQNNGSIDADFVLTIGYDMASFLARSDYSATDKLTPIDYIKVAVYEYDGASGSTLVSGPLTLADLPVYEVDTADSRNNRYALLIGSLGVTSDTTKTYQIKMWLSAKATPSTSRSYFYVNSEVVAEASDTKMAYNVTGKVLDASGVAISGAEVSIQNNSLKATTSSTGEFTINGLLPNTYNLDITYNEVVYQGNLTIREGSAVSLTSMGSTFTPSSGLTLAGAAYTYGTTINKIMSANNITGNSDSFAFSSGPYNLMSSYILTGGSNQGIKTLNITLGESTITNLTLD